MLAWFDQEEAAELRANKGRTDDDFDEAPSLLAVRSAVESLLDRKYRSPHFNKDHRFVVLRIGDGVPLQVRQLSQGYQSMLAMAMDFARRLTIGNPHLAYPSYNSFVSDQMQEELFRLVDYLRHADMNSVPDLFGDRVHSGAFALEAPALMLVDEIDLHLHPLWQQRVLGDLMRTFPLTQFIVTTHSPQVLSTVRRENIRILRETEAGHEAVVPDFSPLAHESGDALARVMGTAVHPPLPVLETVQQYEQKVRAGLENSEDACNLKRTLDAAGYQFQDSDLALWRLLARRQARAG
jgi:predicted ATP-binding protein involved in virulence